MHAAREPTLGELWFNKRHDHSHDTYNISSSDDEAENEHKRPNDPNDPERRSPHHRRPSTTATTATTATARHWDPLLDSPHHRLPAHQLEPLHRQIPQVSIDLSSIAASITQGTYPSNTIDIQHGRPGRDELVALSNALCNNTTIATVRLSHCHLWSTDARVLTYFLTMNNSVKTLDLSHNVITASGARAIAENLVGNTTLRHLLLSSNAIGNEGGQAFLHLMHGQGLKSMAAKRLRRERGGGGGGGGGGSSKRHPKKDTNVPPASRLVTLAVDSNAIDDAHVMEQLGKALNQKRKQQSLQDNDQAKHEIVQLKELLALQSISLNKYREQLADRTGVGGKREEGGESQGVGDQDKTLKRRVKKLKKKKKKKALVLKKKKKKTGS